MLTISVMAIVIFSAFMLVDLQRVVNGGEKPTTFPPRWPSTWTCTTSSNLLMLASSAATANSGQRLIQPRPALRCRPFSSRTTTRLDSRPVDIRKNNNIKTPNIFGTPALHNDVTNKTPRGIVMKRSRPCRPALCLAAQPAWAAYPERAITLIVPAAAGGNADITARLVGQEMSKLLLGQPVVVENRVGAGGIRHRPWCARRPTATPSATPTSARWSCIATCSSNSSTI